MQQQLSQLKIIPLAGKCRHDSMIYCGVFANVSNCNFPTCQQCKMDERNGDKLFGCVTTDGEVHLVRIRYRLIKIRLDFIESNNCDQCGIIWSFPLCVKKCPICSGEV